MLEKVLDHKHALFAPKLSSGGSIIYLALEWGGFIYARVLTHSSRTDLFSLDDREQLKNVGSMSRSDIMHLYKKL
jgi:hypothetical protein